MASQDGSNMANSAINGITFRNEHAILVYSTTQTETTVTVTATLKDNASGLVTGMAAHSSKIATYALTGKIGSLSGSVNDASMIVRNNTSQTMSATSASSYTLLSNKTVTYNRGTSASTQTLTFSTTNTTRSKTSSGSVSISVPARTKHTITYNSNGGGTAPTAQTKYYGIDITLAGANSVTRTDYRLTGWNTKADGTGTAYALGAKYSVNSTTNITLYAQWVYVYKKPSITNVVCYRVSSASSTTEADDGQYIYVSFNYLGGTSNGTTRIAPTCVITIDGTEVYNNTLSDSTTAQTFSHEAFGTYTENNSHSVVIKLYDATDTSGTTQTLTIGSATYPIDILADGSAMGIMTTAKEGQELTIPADTYAEGNLDVAGSLIINGKSLLNTFYPVGSTYTTRTNNNPGSFLGGTWQLIDKCFLYTWHTNPFTFNTTNTSDGASAVILHGHTVEVRLTWKNKVAVSDTSIVIATCNFANYGISASQHNMFHTGFNDGCNAIGMFYANWSGTTLTIGTYDWVTRSATFPTTVNEGCYLNFSFVMQGYNDMADSHCNYFVWTRTA